MKRGKLNVVDEQDKIIGEETREAVHEKGLLHREIHVWFYTPRGEIIFQHRSKSAETYPNLLDATVGGHVEIGQDYEDTAIKECFEETGVVLKPEDLTLTAMIRSKSFDYITKKWNNVLRAVYAYRYNGEISDLKVEKGKSVGFDAWAVDTLFNISDADKKKFIKSIFDKDVLNVFSNIKNLL